MHPLSDETKEAIRDLPLANKKTELLELSQLQPEDQALVVSEIPEAAVPFIEKALEPEDFLRRKFSWRTWPGLSGARPLPTGGKKPRGGLRNQLESAQAHQVGLVITEPHSLRSI